MEKWLWVIALWDEKFVFKHDMFILKLLIITFEDEIKLRFWGDKCWK